MPHDNWIDKAYEVNGETVVVDAALNMILCSLASRLYLVRGYEQSPDFNFAESQHPDEQAAYAMALEAYVFQINVGLD